MSDEPTITSNPLSEADPLSLNQLFAADPLSLKDDDITRIVQRLRDLRAGWKDEPKEAKEKKPRAAKPPKVDGTKLTATDLLSALMGD